MKEMCDLEKQLNKKLDNVDEYREECSSRIKDYRFSDKRIRLLISTSIIIETAMLNAYKISGIYDTRAIFKLYNKGKLNGVYTDISLQIRAVRNSLVHINVGINFISTLVYYYNNGSNPCWRQAPLKKATHVVAFLIKIF